MSRIVDNLVAYRILSMLVTPFDETEAYKLGIIDAHGKIWCVCGKEMKNENISDSCRS